MPKKTDYDADIAVLRSDISYIKQAIDDLKNTVSSGQTLSVTKETCEVKHDSFNKRLDRLENIVYGLLLTCTVELIAIVLGYIKIKF